MVIRATSLLALISVWALVGCSEGHDRFYAVSLTSQPDGVDVYSKREGKLTKIGTTPFSEKIRYTIGDERRYVWRDPAGPPAEVMGRRAGDGSPYSIRSTHDYTLIKEGWLDQPIKISASAGYLQPFSDVAAQVWMSVPKQPEATYAIVLDSMPTGAEVYQVSESGMQGRKLGTTPMTFQVGVARVRDTYSGIITGYLIWSPPDLGRTFIGTEIAGFEEFSLKASFALAKQGFAVQQLPSETLFPLDTAASPVAPVAKSVTIPLVTQPEAADAAAKRAQQQEAKAKAQTQALAAMRQRASRESLQAEYDAAFQVQEEATKRLNEARGLSSLATVPVAGANLDAAAAANQVKKIEAEIELARQRMEIARAILGH